jgi:hypothetical protein
MPDTDTTAPQQTCPACNGTRQVQVTLQNTETGQVTTIPQTCLDCLP